MAYDVELYRLERGRAISAEGVNLNFTRFKDLIDRLENTSRTPDPRIPSIEARLAHVEEEIARILGILELHARQRNEKEFAPLSVVGALLVRMNTLQENVEAAVKKITEMTGEVLVCHDDLGFRIKQIEDKGELATVALFQELEADLAKAKEYARLALNQSTELRRTTNALTKALASPAPERALNQPQYASMAYIGHILGRLAAIEDKLK